MPLFFITAGYFARKNRIFPYIQKNFLRLIIPYLFTSSLLIGNNLLRCIVKNDFEYTPFQYLLSWLCGYGFDYSDKLMSFGALWFLTAIFCSNIIFCALLNCIKNTKVLIVVAIGVSTFGIIISKFILLPFNFDIGMYAVVLECLGFLLRKNDTEHFNIAVILLAITGYLAGLFVYSYDLNTRLYAYPIVSAVAAVCGSFLFLILSQQLVKQKYIGKFLSWCGRNSLTILCLHILEHSIVPWSKVPLLYNNYFLLIFIKVVLMILGVFIIMKIPGINYIYGYKKELVK